MSPTYSTGPLPPPVMALLDQIGRVLDGRGAKHAHPASAPRSAVIVDLTAYRQARDAQ